MATHTAIVVGGGIGGLATARALLRQGWTVTVLEQAPAFEAVGAGIVLAPNAARAMDWLGLGEQLRARSKAHGTAGIRAASGRWLLRTRVEDLQRRFGAPAFALHRADLHQLLVDASTAATLQTGHQVTSVSHGQNAATVRYSGPDGPGTATAELVVAADGVHSRLRATLFPDHPGPPTPATTPGARYSPARQPWRSPSTRQPPKPGAAASVRDRPTCRRAGVLVRHCLHAQRVPRRGRARRPGGHLPWLARTDPAGAGGDPTTGAAPPRHLPPADTAAPLCR
jgi:2-polyprenyl-6-methoxyphenol hydroxylase-like FAD-dependent oxidoreductase